MVLKEDVTKLGFRGDVVSVKAGYARNFLYPEKKAVYATKINLANYKQEKAVESDVDVERERIRDQIMKRLSTVEVVFKRHCPPGKTVPQNNVTAQNIVDMLEKQHGIVVGIARLALSEPIKSLGNHHVKIRVDDDVEDEFEQALKKKGALDASSSSEGNENTQTILAEFESERFNEQIKKEEEEDTASNPQSKKRIVNLKVLVNKR